MIVYVAGGDARNAWLVQLLRARGCMAGRWPWSGRRSRGCPLASPEEIGDADALVLNSPLKTPLSGLEISLEALLSRLRPGARLIFAGPNAAPVLPEGRFAVHDLSRDEEFLRRNAQLTAEGAVWSALGRCGFSANGLPCLVIGWGRIGRSLADLLTALGAEVTVASRSVRGRGQARSRGCRAVETGRMGRALAEARVIFSTPPHPVLDEAALARTDPEALILDLASPPYGVDLSAAERLNRTAWREPGLPGRYCPRSAAAALAEAVWSILG